MPKQVLIVRHAIAQDRDAFIKSGLPDDSRPLTIEGRKKMRRAAAGLQRIVPRLDLIASSPLVRAVETAHLLAKTFPKARVSEFKGLSPGRSVDGILKFLIEQSETHIALVGHEPGLSDLIAKCLGGNAQRVTLKKGGCALIEFDGPVAPSAARLRLFLSPQALRKLAR